MAITNGGFLGENAVTVYQLPSGKVQASFGGRGSKPGQLQNPQGVCFTEDGSVLVVDRENRRIQDFNVVDGTFVRTIGGHLSLSNSIVGIAANEQVIVVTQHDSPCIVVFDYTSGKLLRSFGDEGTEPGQLYNPSGVRISPNGDCVLVTEYNHRLSQFKLSGEWVRTIGSSGCLKSPSDLCFSDTGDIIVAGNCSDDIIEFSGDGQLVRTRWGCRGSEDGEFQNPASVAFAQGLLYVLDYHSNRVQVFEALNC